MPTTASAGVILDPARIEETWDKARPRASTSVGAIPHSRSMPAADVVNGRRNERFNSLAAAASTNFASALLFLSQNSEPYRTAGRPKVNVQSKT